jgi:hypothetical protein
MNGKTRDELYRVCRWCKYYDGAKGICTNTRVFGDH